MTITLSIASDGQPWRLVVDGQAVAEGASGNVRDASALFAEVDAARCLHALVSAVDQARAAAEQSTEWVDAAVPTKDRLQTYARGLVAGLLSLTVPYPGEVKAAGIPPVPPEHTVTFRAGYEAGDAIARITEAAVRRAPRLRATPAQGRQAASAARAAMDAGRSIQPSLFGDAA